LADLVNGSPGREKPGGVTLFKSNGIGLEDVAPASYVYERVKEAGAGLRINWLYS